MSYPTQQIVAVQEITETYKSKADFFKLVAEFFPRNSAEYALLEKAYETGKNAFRNEVREGSGERYFEHLRSVALIALVYLRIRDANLIAACLLHDIVEDIPGWTQERVALEFNRDISELVWWVTKPPVERFSGKEERNRRYHTNLLRAERRARIIKLCDRLHNLLDMWNIEEEKQRRKVRETQDFYLPIAEAEIILIHELEAVLKHLQDSWK